MSLNFSESFSKPVTLTWIEGKEMAMFTNLKLGHSKVLVFAFAVLLFLVANFLKSQAIAAPGQVRALERDVQPFEPIEIVAVEVKGKAAEFGKPLDNDVDWLRGLTLRVKNISGKPISYISIHLRVNPPESGSLPKVTKFSAGSLPFPRNGVLEPAKTLVAPGDFVDVRFDDVAFNTYKNDLQVSKTIVRLGEIFFTDDTAWMRGMLHTRDPKNPFRWNVIQSSQERLEEFYKKLRSEVPRAPSGAFRARSFQLVSYGKKPSSRAQCGCNRYGYAEFVQCWYCFEAYKSVEHLTNECGDWYLEEIQAGCDHWPPPTEGGYCYPYEDTEQAELCF
jgi:hypothetical protein